MAGNEASRVHLRGLSGTYKGREYPLNKDEFTIGRLSGSDLFLDDSTISARHACIRRVGGGYEVSDLRSTNGTCVNGKRIERQRLRADDIIRFDVHEFLFINPVDVSRTIISAVSGETVWYQKTAPEGHPRPIVMAESDLERSRDGLSTTQLYRPRDMRSDNLFWGLLWGLIFAFACSWGGLFLNSWSAKGFPALGSILREQLQYFPLLHLHTAWLGIGWTLPTVFNAVLLLLGLIVGGLIVQSIARDKRWRAALLFGLCYTLLAELAQLSACRFKLAAWKAVGQTAGLGVTQPWLALGVIAFYLWAVAALFSFLGTLLARKK